VQCVPRVGRGGRAQGHSGVDAHGGSVSAHHAGQNGQTVEVAVEQSHIDAIPTRERILSRSGPSSFHLTRTRRPTRIAWPQNLLPGSCERCNAIVSGVTSSLTYALLIDACTGNFRSGR
jgi:hypothetical protein